MQNLVKRASLREMENIGDAVREAGRCTSSLNREYRRSISLPVVKKKEGKKGERATALSRRSSYRPDWSSF